ncbi:anti-sigma factor [Thiothrix subterranea]|uniref:anti-sigma factor n=1 Tax=Thiothrix subterranea TaxID=2735563 RepID=UPI00192B8E14|nr:anti-sigma factor [Thiothrix subterranea]QQZ28600.1 anti-sigma factor [Thiothrix subterranea]
MSRSGTARKNWLMVSLLLTVLLAGILLALPHFRDVHADTATDGLATLREELLANPTSISGNWLRTLNPIVKDVQGDLVWNSTQQQGVLRIRNLPKPKAGQFYQLWLYDAQGNSADGISGGLLTQGVGSEELFMEINTATPVQEPYKFEFTLQSNQQETGQILLMVQP